MKLPRMSQLLSGFAYEPLPFRGVLARRLLAFAVDAAVMLVVGWSLAIGIFIFGILTLGTGFLLFHIIPVLPFIYYTLALPRGGTLGQKLLSLELRHEFEPARRPSHAEALVWSLLLALNFTLSCIPFLAVFTNQKHRAAHDILAGLTMIRLS